LVKVSSKPKPGVGGRSGGASDPVDPSMNPAEDAETARRRAAMASATGSLRAENLVPSAESDHDAELWISGRITADEAVRRAVERHRHRAPGSSEQP